MKKGISTIVIITFLLVLSSCNQPKFEVKPPYNIGNYPLNSVQFGFIAKDKNWLYYIDGENNHNITRTNGTVKETYENTYARGLNLYGDYIYFASHSSDFEGSSGFYRIHKDNITDIEQILSHHINSPIIVNGYIFYSLYLKDDREKSGLYRTKIDGSEQVQLVHDSITNFQWSEGWLYYGVSSGGHVYKMRPSGSNKEKLRTIDDIEISSTEFIVIDDWIYFENRDDMFGIRYTEDASTNIFRLSLVDGRVEALAKGDLHIIDDKAGYIYYSTLAPKESVLYRMNLNGENKMELYRGNKDWNWINIIDETLFLLDWGADKPSRVYRYTPDKQDLIQITGD
ncbi:DUF5050 domain-containing protein [Virgibacillus sp. C22-A2]|uniref:DUF5050 domain-containing protein n=1 Tax=Virgibacillus tibetensis TaxID=3042313 RepID=A0ABU6KKK8_9BACI|nr:DUF5050 domain-containing protein [Virgibacillus sp. C22-A2]